MVAAMSISSSSYPEPVRPKGTLIDTLSFPVTPTIGQEFPDVQLKDWLSSSQADDYLHDLAHTIATRGVVFFRAQKDFTVEMQKQLVQRMGELSGKPGGHGLHIHPFVHSKRLLGGDDDEVSRISSEDNETFYRLSAKWHTDICFEPCPADFTSLRLVSLPSSGGDTMWASGYDVYDRLSPSMKAFCETLTFTASTPGAFRERAAKAGWGLNEGPRGSPHNVGSELFAVHPVVRTNPVSGWKSIFALGPHVAKINELSEPESRLLLDFFVQIVTQTPELQVRLRWKNENDMAIWDNRSVYHTAVMDYKGKGLREGIRTVGIAERPYLDPASKSRAEALGL